MRDALELMLLSTEYPAATQLKERMDTSVKEVGETQEEIRVAIAEESECQWEMEKPVASLEPCRGAATPPPNLPRPGVVTREPWSGEEVALGPAMPLVEEWRERRSKLRIGLKDPGISRAWEQYRELEIAMIGQHGLTLARDNYAGPWSETEREEQLAWRVEDLNDLRRRRSRRERVRFLLRMLRLGWLRHWSCGG